MARKCDDCITTRFESFEQGVYSIHGHAKRARVVAMANWMRSERFLLGLIPVESVSEGMEWVGGMAAINKGKAHDYNL